MSSTTRGPGPARHMSVGHDHDVMTDLAESGGACQGLLSCPFRLGFYWALTRWHLRRHTDLKREHE